MSDVLDFLAGTSAAPTSSGGSSKWESDPVSVAPGQTLEIRTTVASDEAEALNRCEALLVWKGTDGAMLAIDYLSDRRRAPGERELALTIESPDDVATLTVVLRCPEGSRGTMRWSRPTIGPGQPQVSRRVVLASARLPSANLATVSTNLAGIVDHVAPMRSRGPDLICLPEMCASWGVAGDPTQVAIERAPFLDAIGDAARAARSYVVAAFYEREGDAVYNTALLVDRGGQFVGEYRKTHLTALEKLAGVSAGSALEVFETDIGVIGMVICWDLWHPEPARLAALQGAQIIAWPYEADRHPAHRQHTPASRAMENGVTIVGASQASPAPIVDADGTILALLEDGLAHAYAEVQLGGPSDRRRWPHAALRGDNRRNLIEHERNTAIAAKIATVRDRKE